MEGLFHSPLWIPAFAGMTMLSRGNDDNHAYPTAQNHLPSTTPNP